MSKSIEELEKELKELRQKFYELADEMDAKRVEMREYYKKMGLLE